jgi:TRAP-type C4-dicarboxylate transport system permease small subunit
VLKVLVKKMFLGVQRKLGKLAKWFNLVSAAALIAMMGLVNVNVILRPFGKPIWGCYEIVGFLGTVVLSFALIHITMTHGHMAVGIVLSRMPKGFRAAMDIINQVLVVIMMILVAWQSARYGTKIWYSGEISPTLKIPFYPFLYGIALAFALASLVALVNLLKSLVEKEWQPYPLE